MPPETHWGLEIRRKGEKRSLPFTAADLKQDICRGVISVHTGEYIDGVSNKDVITVYGSPKWLKRDAIAAIDKVSTAIQQWKLLHI